MKAKTRIYQLETTNFCNAKCNYCPHGKMRRSFGFVSITTVTKVINYCKEIGQDYIALHHMGEPFLHPKIEQIVTLFKESGIKTEFSTNGLIIRKKGRQVLDSGLTRIRIAVDYNYLIPGYIDHIKWFLELAKNYNTEIRIHTIEGNDLSVFEGINPNVILENKKFDNWAGEVEGPSELEKSNECYFLKYNYVVVLWDGRIVSCCMDYDGKNVIGHIDRINELHKNKPGRICKGCANLQFAEGGEWTL